MVNMKNTRTFCILILAIFLCTCTKVSDINQPQIGDNRVDTTPSAVLLKLLGEYPKVYSRASNENTLNYEYTIMAVSSRFGGYFCVPYSQDGVVQGCMIYPTCNKDAQNGGVFTIEELTGEVINMNSNYLNNIIPTDERYLYSVHFLNWERRDRLKVNPYLSAFAKSMEINTNPITTNRIEKESNTPLTRVVSDWSSTTIHMEYQTTSVVNGFTITAPDLSRLTSWIDEFFKSCSYGLPIDISDYQVYRLYSGSLEIELAFDKIVTRYDVNILMYKVIRYINEKICARSKGYFDATFTYDIIEHRQNTGGGGSSSGGSGGSSGGGIVADGSDDEPHLKSAYRAKAMFNASISTQDWEELETRIDILLRDCRGAGLYTALIEGGRINFKFTDENDAAYYPQANLLKINLKMESNELFHELFHAYQYRNEKNIASFCNAKMNHEIEAHFAQYCYLLKSEDYAQGWSFAAKYADNRSTAIQMLSTYIDNKGRLMPDMSAEYVDSLIEYNIVDVFRKTDAYKDYPYDNSRGVESNFKNLREIAKNC